MAKTYKISEVCGDWAELEKRLRGEELCEKGRCIAWMPLPAPYDRRPPEGKADA